MDFKLDEREKKLLSEHYPIMFAIDEQLYMFPYNNYSEPRLILMIDLTAEMFKKELASYMCPVGRPVSYNELKCVVDYRGISVKRSVDIEEGKIEIY